MARSNITTSEPRSRNRSNSTWEFKCGYHMGSGYHMWAIYAKLPESKKDLPT